VIFSAFNKSESISIEIPSFLNPPFVLDYDSLPIAYPNSSHVYIGNSEYYIEGKGKNITITGNMIPGELIITNVSRSSNIFASITNLNFTLKIKTNSITKSATLFIAFPPNSFYKTMSAKQLMCYDGNRATSLPITYNKNETTGEMINATISNFCATYTCNINSTITVIITNLENPSIITNYSKYLQFSTKNAFAVGDEQLSENLVIDSATFLYSNLGNLTVKPLYKVILSASNPVY